MPPHVLDVSGLVKSFPARRAPWRSAAEPVLRGVDLQVERGRIVCLLGANGAGKSTLLRICASLISADAGSVRVLGEPVAGHPAVRRHVGFATGEDRAFFLRLSGRDNLRFYARLFGLSGGAAAGRIERIAARLGLGDVLDNPVARYSTGMRARLGLARALLHDPALLLLDEPTKSLDRSGVAEVSSLVSELAAGGKAVLWVTHSFAEVEQVAGTVAVLRGGVLRVYAPDRDWRQAAGGVA